MDLKNNLIFLLFTVILTFNIQLISAQDKYFTKTGQITFVGSVDTFEPVRAIHQDVTAIFNVETQEVAALALVKGFRFKNRLMEEHFNESYAESDVFPKATFKGKIIYAEENLTAPKISGALKFHGITKNYQNIPTSIENNGKAIIMVAEFDIDPTDFEIKIPKIVRKKIADQIRVSLRFEMTKRK